MEWTLLIILFVLWSLLEQFRGARKGGGAADAEEGTEGPGGVGPEPEVRRREGEVLPQTVEEWGGEELGIDLERRPRVRDPEALDDYRPTVVSLEEVGAEERGPARTLERPRRPEDHDRFHERYGVPRPVASHREFHRRYVEPLRGITGRRRQPRLPKFGGRTRLQRMVIWSEVLGRPRAWDEPGGIGPPP